MRRHQRIFLNGSLADYQLRARLDGHAREVEILSSSLAGRAVLCGLACDFA
jgi:hypothetical protein